MSDLDARQRPWAGDTALLVRDLSAALAHTTETDLALPPVEVPDGWSERWAGAVAAFALDPLSADLLLLAVARGLDPRVSLALELLSPSSGRSGLAPDVAARVLADRPAWQVAAALAPGGRLRAEGLLVGLVPEQLAPHPRLVGHLLGDDRPGRALAAVLVQRMQSDPRPAVEAVQQLLVSGTAVHLAARTGGWPPPVAATALALLGWRCLVLDLRRADPEERADLLREALTEGVLRGVAVVVGPWEALAEPAGAAAACAAARCPVLTYGEEPWPARGSARVAVDVDVPPLDPAQRREVVGGLLAEAGLEEQVVDRLAASSGWADVSLEPDELQHVVTGLLAQHPDQLEPGVLLAAAARFRERALPAGTRVVETGVRLADVVATPTVLEGLRACVDQARHARTVLDDWGLGRLSRGRRGTSALLCGPPGTGKTLSATAVASELDRPLYVVDVGAVVDKYIGETEKRLERVFAAVEQSQAVLLFDEADALFGKRSGVSDARDRFANIEVSYLLQRLEDFDGVLLLTTNMRNNLDEAFLRRLDHVVTFELPEREERAALWQRHLVPELPGADRVDVGRLAEVQLSGGEIRNALLSAASRSAAAGRPVDTEALLAAADRELRKQGRLVGLR